MVAAAGGAGQERTSTHLTFSCLTLILLSQHQRRDQVHIQIGVENEGGEAGRRTRRAQRLEMHETTRRKRAVESTTTTTAGGSTLGQ